MAPRSTFPIIDQATGGELETRLREWRSTTPPTSFDEIAHALRVGHEVIVSGETVRRWCDELGIPRHNPQDAA